MGNLLETLYDLLIKPKQAFAEIMAGHSLAQAMAVLAGSILISTLAMSAGVQNAAFKLFIAGANILFNFLWWGLSAAVWHFLAELSGGSGSAQNLLKATGFSYFMQIMIVPFYVLAMLHPFAGGVMLACAAAVIAVWSGVLTVLAIQETQALSSAKAILVFLAPLLIFIAIIAVAAAFMGGLAASVGMDIFTDPPYF